MIGEGFNGLVFGRSLLSPSLSPPLSIRSLPEGGSHGLSLSLFLLSDWFLSSRGRGRYDGATWS